MSSLTTLRRLAVAALATISVGATAAEAGAATPGVVSTGPGQLQLFARSTSDGSLLTAKWTAAGWQRWQSLGGNLDAEGDIAAVTRGSGIIDVFVRGVNDDLFVKTYTPSGGWGGYTALGGVISGGPAAASWDGGRIDVFVRATGGALDGNLFQKTWTAGGGWQGDWTDLGGKLLAGTGPGAASRQPGYVDVAVTGTDRRMYIKSYRPDTGWFPYYAPDNRLLRSGPGVAAYPGQGWAGREDYVAADYSSGSVLQNTYVGSGMTGWNDQGGRVFHGTGTAPIWWQDAPGAPYRFDLFTYSTALTPGIPGSQGDIAQKTWTPAGWGGWSPGPGTYNPADVSFLPAGTSCQAAGWASGSVLGVSLGREPGKLTNPQNEYQRKMRAAYNGAMGCFRNVGGGRSPALRMQLSIDAMSNPAGQPGGQAQINAFAQLLREQGNNGVGVVTIMPHDFNVSAGCGYTQAVEANVFTECQIPTPAAYERLFRGIKNAVDGATGRSNVLFETWNEPENPTFYIAQGRNSASSAFVAGQFYNRAAAVLGGAGRLLGGGWLVAGSAEKSEFERAAGQVLPQWAYHPYPDMTNNSGDFAHTNAFENLVGGTTRPVYLTEIGTRLTDNNGNAGYTSGYAGSQFNYGAALRGRLGAKGTRAFLYSISPDEPGGWDSGLADRQGAARQVICGIGGIPFGTCLGNSIAQR